MASDPDELARLVAERDLVIDRWHGAAKAAAAARVEARRATEASQMANAREWQAWQDVLSARHAVDTASPSADEPDDRPDQ